MAILLKAIYMFSVIAIKIPMTFIAEIQKLALTFIWKHEKTVNSQGNSDKIATLEVSQYQTSKYSTEP
jgi:hypothetical protein